MTLIQSLILGLVQAITEFMPISSDGHLNLVQSLLGLTPSLNLDIFLNTATLLSVLFYFRKDWRQFIKLLPLIIIGSIPAGIVGVFLKDIIEGFTGSQNLLPLFFFYTTILVFLTKIIKPRNESLNWKTAFLIGIFQSLAVLPGVSRSASTIFSGLLMGLSPLTAFTYSFFLFIPASFGALLLSLKDSDFISLLTPGLLPSFLLTFAVGCLMLSFLAKIIKNHHFWVFSVYTFILGLGLFFYYWL